MWKKMLVIPIGLLAAACTQITAPAASPTPVPVHDEPSVEVHTLPTEESTFLVQIEETLSNAGAPNMRTYIEVDDVDGAVFQGERHAYADRDVYFLQPKRGGGLSAISIVAPAGIDETSLSQYLPSDDPAAEDEPNAAIQQVHTRQSDSGAWSFDVTVDHPDTGWEDYADGWQVESLDGQIFAVRILLHPHVGERPFTRSVSGVEIPQSVDEVRIRAHDLASGYGPATDAIPLLDGATYDSVTR